MKKILFSLVALMCSMSMNAQDMKVMKNGEVVATFSGSKYKFVFEKAAITGTAKRTGDIDVNWVQLWKDGPKFAEYNVGVTDGKAESYGEYYAWGGTTNQSDSDSNNDDDVLTGDSDTATKLWGSNWRMPTVDELYVLETSCTRQWTTVNGVNGWKITGKDAYASNSVFLPAAGKYIKTPFRDGVFDQGSLGCYWSSVPNTDFGGARYLYLSETERSGVFDNSRGVGKSVRAVLAE